MSLTVSASGITFNDLTTLSTGLISATNLAPNSVGTLQLSAGAVTTNKIALSAVTADRINLVTSLSSNGYQIMPGGLIMQWGRGSVQTSTDSTQTVTFPIPFPNAWFNVICSTQATGATDDTWWICTSFSTTQATFKQESTNLSTHNIYPAYIAIGY